MAQQKDTGEKRTRKVPDWMKAVAKKDDSVPVKIAKTGKITTKLDSAIEETYPLIKFDKSVIYSHNDCDCNLLCDDIAQELVSEDKPLVVGFDMEWPVLFQKGSESKTALIQLCVSEHKCYLFHVSCMQKFPTMLKDLIENPQVLKIGVNISGDLWKLQRDFDIKCTSACAKSFIELGKFANDKLKSKENWSLEGLTKNVLRMCMNKDSAVRCSDWSNFPLSETQQMYAATDAYACLKLYNTLLQM